MTERKDGGPAFPGEYDAALVDKTGKHPAQTIACRQKGASLRQYYAAKAMAAMIAYGGGRTDEDWVSKRALDFADAMLKAEEK